MCYGFALFLLILSVILLLTRATAAAAILVVATITIQQMVASLLAPGCRQADHRVNESQRRLDHSADGGDTACV